MVSFNQIPKDVRVPLFYAEVDNSKSFQFQQAYKTLIIGQRLDTGIASVDEIIMVNSADQAREYFGAGSLLAAMVESYRENDDFTELWCLPMDDNAAGAEASGTVTFGGSPTEDGTINLYLAGKLLQVGVASGDTPTEIAAAVAAAVSTAYDVTAAAAVGEVTFTANHKGELGNDIDIRPNFFGLVGGEKTPAGVTATIVAMAGGTSNPLIATGLANLGDERFDYIAMPYTDSVNLNAIRDFMDDVTGRWAYSKQNYGHVFSARKGTVSELDTFGATRNDPHATVFGYFNSPTPTWAAAAMWAGQAAKSLSIDPARPLQTLPLVGFMAPPTASRFTVSERNILLYSGVATSYTEGGYTRIERSITTYQENSFGQPDPSFLDVQTLATLAYVLRFLNARITQKFPRHKLASDGTRFGEGQAIVTPNIVKSELIAAYGELENKALVENMKAFKANLIVERDSEDSNRLNILFPPDLVNQLRVFAVLAQFRLQYRDAA